MKVFLIFSVFPLGFRLNDIFFYDEKKRAFRNDLRNIHGIKAIVLIVQIAQKVVQGKTNFVGRAKTVGILMEISDSTLDSTLDPTLYSTSYSTLDSTSDSTLNSTLDKQKSFRG